MAVNFHKSTLILSSFHYWFSKRLDWTHVYHQNHTKPIIHWSRVLTGKVLKSWLLYAKGKREKRNRIENAKGWRLERMAKNGIVMWVYYLR
ncbi:hypothetical protein BC829DRAFT_91771 [Chytridium lagenaria]|nr:hypothetical protein BC829DRAFT_91771 [Chytridium lagenaria]